MMHSLVRTCCLVALIGVGPAGVHAGQEVEQLTRTFRVGDGAELDVSNISGDITVTRGEGRDIRIQVTKRASRDSDAARRQLALVDVEVVERGNRVEARTRYPGGHRNLRVLVEFDIVVPARTQVYARSIAGSVQVTGVEGDVQAQSVSGDVILRSVPRLLGAKSVSGNVSLTTVASEGELSASSVSGELEARGLRARAIDLGTVSGNVTLADVACDRATVKTVSGNVQYAGTLAASGRYRLTSHSGDVDLELDGKTGFELEASSFSGQVRSELPLTLKEAAAGRGTSGRRNRAIVGVYGDGSALIEVTTFSGDVSVRAR